MALRGWVLGHEHPGTHWVSRPRSLHCVSDGSRSTLLSRVCTPASGDGAGHCSSPCGCVPHRTCDTGRRVDADYAAGDGFRPSSGHAQRRQALLALGLAGCWAAWHVSAPPTAAAAASPTPAAASFLQPLLPSPPSDLLAQLEGRAPIYQPGVAWALRNRDRQLFYPDWLQGEWEVTARFAAASFPQGRRLVGRTVPGVLKGSMVVALPDVGAAMDAPLRYRARYVASAEEGGVVADRVFNVRELMDAFYGFEVTRRVEYEPLKNPTRLTVVYATPRQDKSEISEDLRKAELIINNRITQQLSPTDFICGELFRQISQASAQGFVGDYETITRFTLLPPNAPPAAPAPGPVSEIDLPAAPAPPAADAAPAGAALAQSPAGGVGARVHVLQRVAAFLQPQDAAFFEAGNQAVAAYDYVYDLTRVA